MEKRELKNQGIEVQFLVSKVMEDAAILGMRVWLMMTTFGMLGVSSSEVSRCQIDNLPYRAFNAVSIDYYSGSYKKLL